MNRPIKIGFLLTHPIQYFAPFFRELARRPEVELEVFFAHDPTEEEQSVGFGVPFKWDIDLTSGYPSTFLENQAKQPTNGFRGYDTPEISQVIRSYEFDLFVLHGWAWKCMIQAYLACKRFGVPVAVRSDSQWLQPDEGRRPSLRSLVKRSLYPLFIRRFDLCLPYGTRSAAYFRSFGARNVHIVPHVIDNAFFAAEAAEHRGRKSELREAFGIPDETVCFLFCGKLEEKKRPADVLDALVRLRKMNCLSSFHLLVVGAGLLAGELQEQAVRLNLPVAFAGFLNQSEISKSFAVADALVLSSSSSETWGLVVNEAMACGLPAIVSNSCGCAPDLVIEGETGERFPVGDIEDLALRMAKLADPAYLRTLGRNASALIGSQFSIPSAVDRFIEVVGRNFDGFDSTSQIQNPK